MKVWVVSFDESETRTDPELSVFLRELDARHAVKLWARTGEEFDLDDDELGMGNVSVVKYDPETGASLAIHIREVEVRDPSTVSTEVL